MLRNTFSQFILKFPIVHTMIAEYLSVFIIAFLLLKLTIPWLIFFYQLSKIPYSELRILKHFRWNMDNKYLFNILYDNVKASKHEITKGFVGFHTGIVVKSPTLAKIVMTRCLDKSNLMDFVGLKRSVLFGSGDDWKVQRKVISHYFTSLSIQKLIPLFDVKSDVLMESLGRVKCEFDVFNFIAALTLETVLSNMGLDVDLQLQDTEIRDVAIENFEK